MITKLRPSIYRALCAVRAWRGISVGLVLCAALTGGCSSETSDEGIVTQVDEGIAAQISLENNSSLGSNVYIEAQTLDGVVVGTGSGTPGGAVLLDLAVDASQPIIVAAVNPDDPKRRRYAYVLGIGDGEASGVTNRQATADAIEVDSRSTARFFARTAASDSQSTDLQLEAAHASQIDVFESRLDAVDLCSGSADSAIGDAARELAGNVDPDDPTTQVILQAQAIAQSTDAPEIKLLKMQQLISANVRSVNQWSDFSLVGIPGIVANRVLIAGLTNQTINSITNEPINEIDLAAVTATTLFTGWGNCRENAMTAAGLASLIPEVKQILIVGLERSGAGQHAVAIACLQPKSVADLATFSVFDGEVTSPKVLDADCHVVDPWLDEGASSGNSEPLTAEYVRSHNWYFPIAVKPVILDNSDPPTSTGTSGKCNCAEDVPTGCEPFSVDVPDDTDGNTTPVYPRIFTGTGNMVRSIEITWDPVSNIECPGTGQWTATLQEDGTMTLTGMVNVRASFNSSGAYCDDAVKKYFFWNGTWTEDSFKCEFSYDTTTQTMNGIIADNHLKATHSWQHTSVLAGWGEQTLGESLELDLTL